MEYTSQLSSNTPTMSALGSDRAGSSPFTTCGLAHHDDPLCSQSASSLSQAESECPSTVASTTQSEENLNSFISSPEIQALINRDVLPTLDTIYKALEDVSSSSIDSEEEKTICISQLRALAADLEAAHKGGKKLLCEAMRARSNNCPEICRSKCIQIVHNIYTEVETKIYAYNMLSTQASVGQAERFLAESTALVHGHIEEEGDTRQFLGTIAILRESARERVRMASRRRKWDVEEAEDEESDDWYRKECSNFKEKDRVGKSMHLDLPEATEGFARDVKATPKTQRILQWAESVA